VGKSTLGAQMRMAVLVLGIFHFLNLQVQTFVFNYSMVTILLKNADGTLLPLSFFFFFFLLSVLWMYFISLKELKVLS
jgi:hypothetical protein